MKKIENELFLKFSGIIFYTLLLLIEIPKYFCKKFFGIHRASLARNNLIIFFIFDMFFYYIDYYTPMKVKDGSLKSSYTFDGLHPNCMSSS